MSKFLILFYAVFGLVTSSVAHAADYVLVPVRGNTSATVLTGINELGEASATGLGDGGPISYGLDDGGLFQIPSLPGYRSSYAMGINNSNRIIGYGAATFDNQLFPKAYSYDVLQGRLSVLTTPLELPGSVAFAVNASGAIAGGVGDVQLNSQLFPAVWTGDTLKRYPWTGVAFALNDNGNFAGSSFSARGGTEQAVLVKNGTRVDLGMLTAHAASRAMGINNCNDVVGYSSGGGGSVAFKKLAGGSMKPIGGTDSVAYDINNRRQIVSSGSEVFITEPDGTRTSLRERATNADEWYGLFEARSINDSGVIAGVGFYWVDNGPLPFEPRGFIAYPLHEPTAPIVCR